MGVRKIWQWRAKDVKEETDAITVRMVEVIGAQSFPEKWATTCELLLKTGEAERSARELYKVKFSEEPGMCYLVTTDRVIEVGEGVQTLLDVEEAVSEGQPKKRYSSRSTYTFEANRRFEVGDFILRVGCVRVGSVLDKSILVEVEYTPCAVVSAADALLTEFFRNVVPSMAGLSASLKQPGATFPMHPLQPPDLSALFSPSSSASATSPPPNTSSLAHYTRHHLARQYVANIKHVTRASQQHAQAKAQPASGNRPAHG